MKNYIPVKIRVPENRSADWTCNVLTLVDALGWKHSPAKNSDKLGVEIIQVPLNQRNLYNFLDLHGVFN